MFLTQHGVEVTGMDFAASAIEKARRRADAASVEVRFMVDDLTDLRNVNRSYDFLVDYGTIDDLDPKDRDLYVQDVVPLTHPGSRYLLWCFEWPQRWWERLIPFEQAFVPGEAQVCPISALLTKAAMYFARRASTSCALSVTSIRVRLS